MRTDKRNENELRPVSIETGFLKHAEGSALIKLGDTHVLCAATVEDTAPPFLKGTGKGWITAEYGMLPRATNTRTQREAAKGKQTGRTQEIQRLIGRSLRAVTALDRFGERTVRIDCDVIQADGGTRTASITGAWVALHLAFQSMVEANAMSSIPLTSPLAAVSVGVVGGRALLDLCYEEDSKAMVDLNVVMAGGGKLVEVQGTAEDTPFDRGELDAMLDLAGAGIEQLFKAQNEALGL